MPPDMGTQPSQARERERSEKDTERAKSSKVAEPAVASSSGSTSQRVGNYRLDGEIGRGSFATVYLGYKSVGRSVERLYIADLFPSRLFLHSQYTSTFSCIDCLHTEIPHSYSGQGGLSPEAHRQTPREPRERNQHPQVDS